MLIGHCNLYKIFFFRKPRLHLNKAYVMTFGMIKNLSYLGTEKLIYKNNKNIKTCLFPKVEAINLSRSGFLEAEGFWFTPGSGKPEKY